MKDQWKKGLQWGGMIWLAWLSVSTLARALLIVVQGYGFPPVALIPAIGWTLALALAWTRWSRLGIAIGIAAHVYYEALPMVVTIGLSGFRYDSIPTERYLDLAPFLSSFLPCCLPLVPLLIMAPSTPRYAAALALVGRWADSARELVGLRWILVAAGVLALHSAAPDALEWWDIDFQGHVVFRGWHVTIALLPCAILFGLAAIRDPRERVSAR